MYGYVLIICQYDWLSICSSISSVKWHIIYIVFVHCYPLVTTIFATILLHVISLCVTIITLNWNPVCLFIVNVCYVVFCLFFKLFRMSSPLSVLRGLFNWSCRYGLAVISNVFMCLLFFVITNPFFVMCIMYDLLLWLWPTFPTTVPWIHGPPSSH